jgi:hypothetical protein
MIFQVKRGILRMTTQRNSVYFEDHSAVPSGHKTQMNFRLHFLWKKVSYVIHSLD